MTTCEVQDLVIGAGPAGLSAAIKLFEAGRDIRVIEQADEVGGLARTYRFKEDAGTFCTDYGPHRFFSKNTALYDFAEDLLGSEEWLTVARHTRQYIKGRFFDYPVNVTQTLRNLTLGQIVSMMADLVIARFQYRLQRKPIRSFEDYIVAHFGRKLGEFNMLNYTEKIWGVPCCEIHPDWAVQRIKGLSLHSIIVESMRRTFRPKLLRANRSTTNFFHYPSNGAGRLYETIARKINKKKRLIKVNCRPIAIHHYENRIVRVDVSGLTGSRTYEPGNIVETICLPEFIALLSPEPPAAVVEAVLKLRYRHHRCLLLTLNRTRVSDDQWIYFPDQTIPFARMSEMKNFSASMAPQGKTSLLVEYFCFKSEKWWTMSKEELVDITLSHLERMGFCNRREVRCSYDMRQENAYPIYDLDYKRHLATIQEYLDRFDNLYYIGRPGRFRYNNQDHSIEMGFQAAESIITGASAGFDHIATEQASFEEGISKRV